NRRLRWDPPGRRLPLRILSIPDVPGWHFPDSRSSTENTGPKMVDQAGEIGQQWHKPSEMSLFARRLLFLLFFVSGFCSLVYQVVWTRLAFASFGIITPVLSVVLAVFMLGLAVGAWVGGRFSTLWVKKTGLSAAILYGCAEGLIGLGGFAA